MSKSSNVARRHWLLGLAGILIAGVLGSAPARADSTKKTYESVGSMLKQAGFDSKIVKRENNSYVLLFKGQKAIGEFPIIIVCVDDTISMMAYIAAADKITRSPELTAGLLQANTSYNFMKIIFDTKGNLLFKYDAFENMIDAADVKKLINMMAENTVNFYANAPFIKK